MGGLLGFLGIVRGAAWVYLILMFLTAVLLFFLDRRRKHSAPKEAARPREHKAA